MRKIIVLLVGIVLPSMALAGFPEPEIIATNLRIPWALAFAPDGRIFFTERPGTLRVINADGTLQVAPVIGPPDIDVLQLGEGGLMGLEIDPNFSDHGYLYVYFTTRNPTRNNLVRLIESGGSATVDQVLLDNVPAGSIHDGGRIKIGPDGMMYVTTGNANMCSTTSQNLESLAGKILRMNLDGTAPADNPFYPDYPLIYTFGHRNPQGLAWDDSGQLYETEHGPTADVGCGRVIPRSWYDEVNIIFGSGNYGWPLCYGPYSSDGGGPCDTSQFLNPVWWSEPPNSQPPTGAAFYALPGAANKSFLYGMLGTYDVNPEFYIHARQIHYLTFADDGVTIIDEGEIYHNVYGRIREVIVGPDGYLYFTTSNTDGRYGPGVPPDDDKIYRVQFNAE